MIAPFAARVNFPGMNNTSQHQARKRFGQNFLQDPGIIQRIARAINANTEDHVVEIGPGQGALTASILTSGCQLDAIELDRDLIPILENQFSQINHFHLHQGDALNFDFSTLGNDLRVVGNLPYNISTPLIFHLLSQQTLIKDMHFMLQLEVVNRLAATPGNKNYGRLSVMAQYYCQVYSLFEVPPEAFNPRPKVQSAIVRLTPHVSLQKSLPHPAQDVKTLERVLRTAFNQRRKTLRNSLKELLSESEIKSLGINPSARPETLTLQQFVSLSDAITDAQTAKE